MKRQLTALALLWAAAACGTGVGTNRGDIDRETFVATYVDLRLAALGTPDMVVPDEQRAEILARHGVDGESLLRFADVHGRDVDYMSELWNEVDEQIQAQQPEAKP
jgi:hypothetical protein